MNLNQKRIDFVSIYLKKLNLDLDILNYYKGRNILVTGGAGAIGSNLIIALSHLVWDEGKIIILDNLSSLSINKSIFKDFVFWGYLRTDNQIKRLLDKLFVLQDSFHFGLGNDGGMVNIKKQKDSLADKFLEEKIAHSYIYLKRLFRKIFYKYLYF